MRRLKPVLGRVSHRLSLRRVPNPTRAQTHCATVDGSYLFPPTCLMSLSAALTHLSHPGEGVVSTLEYLTGGTQVRPGHVCQPHSLNPTITQDDSAAIASSEARKVPCFDATVPDFDIPAQPTNSERLRRPSQLPRGVFPVAHSDVAARPPSSSSAAERQLPTEPRRTSAPPRLAPSHG